MREVSSLRPLFVRSFVIFFALFVAAFSADVIVSQFEGPKHITVDCERPAHVQDQPGFRVLSDP